MLQRVGNPEYGSQARLEALAVDPDAAAAMLAGLRDEAMRRSVLWRQVVSFTGNPYGRSMSGLTFHRRPELPASHVVLPEGTLGQVRAHVVGLAQHRDRLREQGQHLKRGVLLYGPPGTGKLDTVRHLVSAAPDTTVVLLSGTQMAHVGAAAQIARAHRPAIVVIEDCDLIAEDRDHHVGGAASPLLFTLLDAMDGLDEDAAGGLLLTTNRAEALEKALAQRPGRVDLAVEIPLPDESDPGALIDLYAAGLRFSATAVSRAARESRRHHSVVCQGARPPSCAAGRHGRPRAHGQRPAGCQRRAAVGLGEAHPCPPGLDQRLTRPAWPRNLRVEPIQPRGE